MLAIPWRIKGRHILRSLAMTRGAQSSDDVPRKAGGRARPSLSGLPDDASAANKAKDGPAYLSIPQLCAGHVTRWCIHSPRWCWHCDHFGGGGQARINAGHRRLFRPGSSLYCFKLRTEWPSVWTAQENRAFPWTFSTFWLVVENYIHINAIEKNKITATQVCHVSPIDYPLKHVKILAPDHQGATCSSSRGIWDVYSAAPEAKLVTLCIVSAAGPVNVVPPCS